MTYPDVFSIAPEQRDLIADRIGTSLRRGVYVLALDGFEIKGGERVINFEDLSGVLFGITRAYPNYEVLSAFFEDHHFTFRDITDDDFKELHNSENETHVDIEELFNDAVAGPAAMHGRPLKD